MNIYAKFIIILSSSIIFQCYISAQTVFINNFSKLTKMGKSISVLEDKSGKLAIDEVNSHQYYSCEG